MEALKPTAPVPLPTWAAVYTSQQLRDYQGNPLIEALPPILSRVEAAERMLVRPPFDPGERLLPAEQRFHVLGRLRQVVIPTKACYKLERVLSYVLRQSYVPRNPFSPEAIERLYSAQTPQLTREQQLSVVDAEVTVVGLSREGKSTAIDAALRTYLQQVIHHTKYHDQKLALIQVVWLKIICPANGSVASLCREFGRQLDLALGSRKYEVEFSKPHLRQDQLEAKMRQLCATYFVGVLIIDEIQRLRLGSGESGKPLMNFLQNLREQLKVALVFVGTYKAIGLFKKEMKDAGRACENGLIDFRVPHKRDEDWDKFAKRLLQYNWLRNPVAEADIDGLLDELFDCTQGIKGFLVILIKLCQQAAIVDGTEILDKTLVRETYYESMALLHPAINALRSNTPDALSKFEDLLPPEAAMTALFEDSPEDSNIDAHLDQVFGAKSQPPAQQKQKPTEQTACPAGPDFANGIDGQDGNNNTREPLPAGYRDLQEFAAMTDPYEAMKALGIIVKNPWDFEAACLPR